MFRFSSIFTQQSNKLKNAFRFENQNLTWTYEEFQVLKLLSKTIQTHSNAFAYGLVDQGWKQGDHLLFLLGRSNTAESAAGFVGAAKAGVVVVPFRTNDSNALESAITTVGAKGIVFSPNMVFEDGKMVDALQKLIPELNQSNKVLNRQVGIAGSGDLL